MGGKTPQEYEDPIPNMFYYISDKLCDNLFKLKITPNFITTLRLILMIVLTILVFYKKYLLFAGILFIFCFFLDHLDGEYARKYNMVTKFGDYYDHIVDNTYFIPLLIIIFYRNRNIYLILFFLILLIISTILIGCQEKYMFKYKNNISSKSLKILQKTCPFEYKKLKKSLSVLRYFGQGFLILFIFFLIIQTK